MSSEKSPPYATTIEVRDGCFCLHLQRAARIVARRFDDAFRPVDLTSGQFSLLMSLNRPAPPNMGDVATLLGMDRTTLTANLKPMERGGLVKVSVDPDDRRGRRLMLTGKGRARLKKALPIWRRAQAAIERQLSDGDPDRLRRDLRALF
jgi:DNA-binding MarR family transcriptional regulator